MGRISADQAVLTKYSTAIHLEPDLSNDITWSSSAQFMCCVSRTMQKNPSLSQAWTLSQETFYCWVQGHSTVSAGTVHPSIRPSILFLPLLLRHSGVLEATPTWTNNCPQPQVLSQCIGCVFGGSQGTLRNPTQTHGDLKTESLPAWDLPGDPNHDLLALRCYSANHCTTTASSHSNHHHVRGHNRNCSIQSSA